MISSAIWNKLAPANFLKTTKFVVFEKFASACLFQTAREKTFDYFLIIYK